MKEITSDKSDQFVKPKRCRTDPARDIIEKLKTAPEIIEEPEKGKTEKQNKRTISNSSVPPTEHHNKQIHSGFNSALFVNFFTRE